jgi:hypothetical protein
MPKENGFPKVDNIKEQIQSDSKKPTNTLSSSASISQQLSQFGVTSDNQISQENVQKISQMSKEEVEQEQKELLELFNPKQLSILKKLGQRKKEQKP